MLAGGRASRNKGLRVEYILRDYLRALGYEAVRVPLSGASEGFKSDVIATKDGLTHKFEMKARAHTFDSIYRLFYKNRDEGLKAWRFFYQQPIVISTEFEELRLTNVHFPKWVPPTPLLARTGNKILRLQALLGEADYLVIKGDHKPLLFIRYWA